MTHASARMREPDGALAVKVYKFRERENAEIWEIPANTKKQAWNELGEEYIYALELQRSVRKRDRMGYAMENFDFLSEGKGIRQTKTS